MMTKEATGGGRSGAANPSAADRSIRTPDGRTLLYREYGDPQGQPVFYFHGTPGSRIAFAEDDPVSHELGIRLVTPERPGYGGSTFQPGRRLTDWATDIECLADHLDVDRFAVAGASGGGPHAAACAALLPSRVRAAALISSSSPVDAPEAVRGMAWSNRIGLALPRYAPWLLRGLLAIQAMAIRRYPEAFMRSMMAQVSEPDRLALEDPELKTLAIAHLQEAVRPGSAGIFQETKLLSRDWGFDLSTITVPVQVWVGAEDLLAPPSMGRYLAAQIPGSQLFVLEDTGHFIAEEERHWRRILAELVRAR